ncbi:MAG TPA: hypothetical protein PLA50_04310, partial [Bacteroidia bacterium]|nr:hypothetical protein [Bacteroidia bacterium]
MKKAILVATVGALALSANAGDWGKAPVSKNVVVEECVDLGGEISVGYETDYIFRGVRAAGDSVWADVNYTFDGLAVPVTVGALYLNGINGGPLAGFPFAGPGAGTEFDKLDLYVSAAVGTFAGFDVTLGYTHYVFPEIRSTLANNTGYGELNLGISRSLGFVDLAYQAAYGFAGSGSYGHGWYHQLGVEKSFGLTDNISLVLGTGVAYSDQYSTGNFGKSGWNHYYVTAALPIELNCRTTLTPYIG